MTSVHKIKQQEPIKQRLFFDKIAFTFPILQKDRLKVINRINSPDFHNSYQRQVYGNHYGRYQNNYQFEIDKNNSLLLSLYPINSHHNFLRVEYNPDKMGKEGRIRLREFLIKLLGLKVTVTIYYEASVTRLDLTLDIFDMEPSLYLHKNRVTSSEIFGVESSQEIASQIVGSDASHCRITLYDKSIESGKDRDRKSHHRLEIRLRHLDCTMDQLSEDLLDEFKKLNFFQGNFLDDKRFLKKFRNNANMEGLCYALGWVTDNERRCYLRYLEGYRSYPIVFEDLDFDLAHRKALGSLIGRRYRERLLGGVG